MIQEANDEIEEIPTPTKISKNVMAARVEIYSAARAWEHMREVAAFLVREWPEEAHHWIALANATRRCRSITEAVAHLVNAMALHPDEPIIPFTLACYAAQAGRIEDAKLCLVRAIALSPDIRQRALDDPDLEPLWAGLGKHPSKA
jgi:predicted Zn-dependent protease